jgi:hypothetical protein
MAAGTIWMAAAAAGSFLALGTMGSTAAQQQTPHNVNVDSIVAEMGLTGEARSSVVAQLNELNERLDSGDDTVAYCYDVWSTLSNLDVELTQAQWQQLHRALWDAGILGRMGHRGRGMMGAYGAGWRGDMPGVGAGMGRGGMHRGYGRHHRGPVGQTPPSGGS